MTVYARLEDERHWERDGAGWPSWARLLCGMANTAGRHTCSGPLAWVNLATGSIRFDGMLLGDDGVYRPTAAALKTYISTGRLREPEPSAARTNHLLRHRSTQSRLRREMNVPLAAAVAAGRRIACPRCGRVQALFDDEDRGLLQATGEIPHTPSDKRH